MKGVSFQKPFELNLAVEGETWRQGDRISGVLTVKNQGVAPASLQDVHVSLAHGELKKVRLKSADAFSVISSVRLDAARALEPRAEEKLSWSFVTDRNCRITDTSGSLFLLYGQGIAPEKLGQLQLPVSPYWVIQEILQVFQIEFRFVVKTQKWNKGSVDVKLAPPSARAFAAMEFMVVSFRFDGERLETRYQFQLKKIEASAAAMDVKKVKKEFRQDFDQHEYLLTNGRLNQVQIEKAIRDVLGQLGMAP